MGKLAQQLSGMSQVKVCNDKYGHSEKGESKREERREMKMSTKAHAKREMSENYSRKMK